MTNRIYQRAFILMTMVIGLNVASAEQAWQVTAKAWKAMGKKNWDEVVRLADRAEREWGPAAKRSNATLKDYPKGDAAKKFATLNELAVITMLKGDALLKKGNKEGAAAAYWKLISDYKYGQCWDKKGWWWQPAKAAQKKVKQLGAEAKGKVTEKKAAAAGGEQPSQVTGKAWKANGQKKWDEVIRLAERSEREWGTAARRSNATLSAYPKGKDARKYATLNELATITLLKGGALLKKGDKQGAIATYKKLVRDYKYGQCWDNKGWWWQPAKAAQDSLNRLDPGSKKEVHFGAPPLKKELRLKGKKGICLTLRPPGKAGSWEVNIPRTKKVKPYWNYSWGMQYVPGQPSDIEFLPMAWGAWGADGLKKSLNKHVVPQIKAGKVTKFLGYNEPDKPEQANMNYKDALKYWPILESLNVPLCSPACANPEGVNDDTVQGVHGTWMRDFMTEADKRGYRVDYIGAHWYGGTSPTDFKEKMLRIYKKYGNRPLLITEFSPADWGAKTPKDNRHTPEAVLDFMKEVLPWMESQNWIAGYAWFSFGIHEPQGTSSALYNKDGSLTAIGRYYASVTNENPKGDQSIKPDPPRK